MTDQNMHVVVIGGGPAGIMAAYSVKTHHPEYNVTILDKEKELGRKLCISGSGRGNLTNSNLITDSLSAFHTKSPIVPAVFAQFGLADIQSFFEKVGIPLYEEEKTHKGKLFPVIDHAKTVRDILVDVLVSKNIKLETDTVVTKLIRIQDQWTIETNKGPVLAMYVIVATGGKSYPALGADGSGYTLLSNLGHTIISPVPVGVPLVSKNPFSHHLQGEKYSMKVDVLRDGTVVETEVGDVLFTSYGISGSAVLEISRSVSFAIHREKKSEVKLRLSFFPHKTTEDVVKELDKRWENNPTWLVGRSLWGMVTTKVANAICIVSGFPKEKRVSELTSEDKHTIVSLLTSYELSVTDTRGWNEAEFTAGGVSLDELENTLASKKVANLYVAGEVVDVDGSIGGYNLSWAWASGWVAGKLS